MIQAEQSITATLEHFDFVVEAFHKAAVFAANEVIRDLTPSASQGVDEIVEATQSAFCDMLDPGPDFGLSSFLGDMLVKDGGQLFSPRF